MAELDLCDSCPHGWRERHRYVGDLFGLERVFVRILGALRGGLSAKLRQTRRQKG
jgi:hypothetical protein